MKPHLVQRKCCRSSCICAPQLGQLNSVLAGDEWVVEVIWDFFTEFKGCYVALNKQHCTVSTSIRHDAAPWSSYLDSQVGVYVTAIAWQALPNTSLLLMGKGSGVPSKPFNWDAVVAAENERVIVQVQSWFVIVIIH